MIECRELTKTFGSGKEKLKALDGVSFRIASGQIAGLLGPDGAGKTTLMRHLCGLLRPDSGSVSVLGLDSFRDSAALQSQLGYVPQKFGLYENLTIAENIRLYAQLHGISREELAERVPRLLEITLLERFTERMAGKLSGGMKQKLALICALISRPRLMLLDEPTVGVDVLARREMWQILRRIVEEEKMTVIASTAYLDEADYCDQTLILFEGRLLAQGTPEEIRRKAANFTESPTFEEAFQVLICGSVPQRLTRKAPVRDDAPVRIRVEELVQRFGNFTAVDRISFQIRSGEIFGLLGANGAGKTTTFRMLCGLNRPTEGKIEVDGKPLAQNLEKMRAQTGYVAQKFSLYGDLSVRQNMEFYGGAYGVRGKLLQERIAWAMDAFQLGPFSRMNAEKLSMGFKRRLAMACALLHEPSIVFLDEATSGTDPISRHEFWKRILELADSGVAVIITTHFMDEAQYCDRILIIRDGRSIALGTTEEIRKMGGNVKTLEDAFVNLVSSGETGTQTSEISPHTDEREPDPAAHQEERA